MPLFSIYEVAMDKHRAVFEDYGGYIEHKPTGQRVDFIVSSGVYFINMKVRRELVDPSLGRHGNA